MKAKKTTQYYVVADVSTGEGMNGPFDTLQKAKDFLDIDDLSEYDKPGVLKLISKGIAQRSVKWEDVE